MLHACSHFVTVIKLHQLPEISAFLVREYMFVGVVFILWELFSK